MHDMTCTALRCPQGTPALAKVLQRPDGPWTGHARCEPCLRESMATNEITVARRGERQIVRFFEHDDDNLVDAITYSSNVEVYFSL